MLTALRTFQSFRSQRAIGRRVSGLTQDTDRLSASLSSADGSYLSDTPAGDRSGKVRRPLAFLRHVLFVAWGLA